MYEEAPTDFHAKVAARQRAELEYLYDLIGMRLKNHGACVDRYAGPAGLVAAIDSLASRTDFHALYALIANRLEEHGAVVDRCRGPKGLIAALDSLIATLEELCQS